MKTYRDLQILVAKKANVGKGLSVLDAGTGPSAYFAVRLAEIVGNRGLIVAIDYEREYASRIKEAIADSGFSETISFILADLRYIPVRDCALDALCRFRLLRTCMETPLMSRKWLRNTLGSQRG